MRKWTNQSYLTLNALSKLLTASIDIKILATLMTQKKQNCQKLSLLKTSIHNKDKKTNKINTQNNKNSWHALCISIIRAE
jgi:hypothetical protein